MNNYQKILSTVFATVAVAFACGGSDNGAVSHDDAGAITKYDAAQKSERDARVVVNGHLDECAEPEWNDCDDNADCTDIVEGSYECRCKTGYEGDGRNCQNINECEGETNTCSPVATCTDTDGGFTCRCDPGFEGDGTQCEDIDECSDSDLNDCEENERCRNTRGSYRCECVLPFSEDENGECRPVCEVVMEGSDGCDPNAICRINTDGEAECVQCQFPYFGDGKECIRDDACENLDCGNNAVCVEGYTSDSRECACAMGFEGDPEDGCSDIDECVDESDNDCKRDKSECLNLAGGYYCVAIRATKIKMAVVLILTNAMFYSCIVIPESLWGDTHECRAEDWVAARENRNDGLCETHPCICNADQVDFLYDPTLDYTSTTTFEMVKIETLDREPSCGEAIGAF